MTCARVPLGFPTIHPFPNLVMSRFFPFFRPRSILMPVLMLLGGGVWAQESAPSSTLTLGEALQRAAEHNPDLLASTQQERAAAALIEQAGVRPNPTLELSLENFAGTGVVRGTRGLEATVQASQTFERGGKRDKRVTLAERERSATERLHTVRRNAVLAATAEAYLETLAAQQRLTLAAEPRRLARETLAAAENRVQAGVASAAETARARAGLAMTETDLARAEAALQSARAKLTAHWGGTAEDVGTLPGHLQLPAALPDHEIMLANLARHPRLALQQDAIASQRAGLELAQAEAAPDVTLGGGLRFLRESSDAAIVAGLSVPLPVRHRNQGNIRAARALLAGAEQGGRAVEIALRAEFTAAWQDLTTAYATVKNLREQALPALADAHAAVHHAYAQGQLPLIDVLDAQRALVALQREILEAETDGALAFTRLAALTDPTFGTVTALISQP